MSLELGAIPSLTLVLDIGVYGVYSVAAPQNIAS